MGVRRNSIRSYTAHSESPGYLDPRMVPILPLSGGPSPILVSGEERRARSGDVHF